MEGLGALYGFKLAPPAPFICEGEWPLYSFRGHWEIQYWHFQNGQAKEVEAPQLLGRSDKQGQFWSASSPKYCPLPFPLSLHLYHHLQAPLGGLCLTAQPLHCSETSQSSRGRKCILVLVGTFLLSVSVSHPSCCWATVKIHLLTPRIPSGSCWGSPVISPALLVALLRKAESQDSAQQLLLTDTHRLQTSLPTSHHVLMFIPNDGNEQNPSLGNPQASKSGCDFKH